jgi:hypothetical protein
MVKIRIKSPAATIGQVPPGCQIPFRGQFFTVCEDTNWMEGSVDGGVVELWKPMLEMQIVEENAIEINTVEVPVVRRRRKE